MEHNHNKSSMEYQKMQNRNVNRMNHGEHDHSKPAEDREISDWKRKLIGSWIFAIPIAILMVYMRILNGIIISEDISILILLVLGFPVVFVFGFSTLKS